MVNVDFCAQDRITICVFESIFGITPVIAFAVLGLMAYRAIPKKNPYVRTRFTTRHSIKLISSGTLAFVCAMYCVLYPLLDENISLRTEITWFLSACVWVANVFLMRIEYKNLGYTSHYLRGAWITVFVCQTILLIFGIANEDVDNFGKLSIIYYLNELQMLVIIIFGFIYSDDFPPPERDDPYGSVISNQDVPVDDSFVSPESLLNRTSQNPYEDFDSFKPLNTTLDGSKDTSIKHIRKNEDSFKRFDDSLAARTGKPKSVSKPKKTNKNDESRSFDVEELPIKGNIGNIEKLEVLSTDEIERFDKKQMVYFIEFYIKQARYLAKRSYSEFKNLYKDLEKSQKNLEGMPDLPPKRINKKDEAVINERKEAFDKFLNWATTNQIGISFLEEFLQPIDVVPFYGKLKKSDEKKRKEAEKRENDSGPNSLIHNEESKNDRMNTSDLGASDDFKRRSNTMQIGATQFRTYNVESLGIMQVGKDATTHYKLKVKDTTSFTESTILKRYKEFKILHEELKKKLGKSKKDKLPELPYKGKFGLVGRDDPRVIEFRKANLRSYLQTILNTPELQDIPFLQEFIRSRPIEP